MRTALVAGGKMVVAAFERKIGKMIWAITIKDILEDQLARKLA